MRTALFILIGLFAAPTAIYFLLLGWLAITGWHQRRFPRYGVCRVCGCTDEDCFDCIVATGEPCCWIDESHTLCSRCVDELATADLDDVFAGCSPLNARSSSHKGREGRKGAER